MGTVSATVVTANVMVSRVLLLYWIANSKQCVTILEQPNSSLMYLHPRFQHLLGGLRIYRTLHWLGYFGAESPKPIHLYSNVQFVNVIDTFATRDVLPESEGVVSRVERSDGVIAVTGDRNLKSTQAYPRDFGVAVAAVYHRFRPEVVAVARVVHERCLARDFDESSIWFGCQDEWPDACLVPVFELLKRVTIARHAS
jgi:hypothetical protein